MPNSFLKKLVLAIAISMVSLSGWAQSTEAAEDYKKGQEGWQQGDLVTAMPHLKKAADAGHAEAQALYGYLLDEADNDVEAADYYKRAADQGNSDGAFGLAGLYTSGDGGLTKDYALALEWLNKAANAGHVQATISLSQYYAIGRGVAESEKTPEVALKWIQKAADHDDIPSLARLERAYREGNLGLSIDLAKADVIKNKIFKLQGIDPNKVKTKRRSRL